jgi:hypothetical protein
MPPLPPEKLPLEKPAAVTHKPGSSTALFSWESPDDSLLEDRRGPLPEFPHGIFAPRLTDWLARASHGAGTQIDFVALPMLGVASSLIGKARRVQASTSWIQPCTLWAAIVGSSGDRKTPGLEAVTKTLDRIEAENKPKLRAAELAHRERAEKAKAIHKRWKKDCEAALAKHTEPPRMPIEAVDPGDFIHPALYVSDSTVQRLGRLCVVRPRGMLQVRDELVGLFAGLRQSGARQFYIECWNGGRHVVERVDEDRGFEVPNLLVGIMGGFQPDKIARAFAGDQDGLYARFLFAWASTPEYRPLTDAIGEVDASFKNMVLKLIRLPAEDADGNFAPRDIPLSDDARRVFESFRLWVDYEKRSVEGRDQEWLAKSEHQVLRLAGTLAYLTWAEGGEGLPAVRGIEWLSAGLEPNEIEAEHINTAVRLIREYFWPHARATLRQIGLTSRHQHARRTLKWIRADVHRTVVSREDIRRDALANAIDAQQTQDVIDHLVKFGWLRKVEGETTGGRPRHRWAANPRLWGLAESPETAESPPTAPYKYLSAVRAVSARPDPEK